MSSRNGNSSGYGGTGLTPRPWLLLVVLLIYLGMALPMTWPLVQHMTDHLPGPSTDSLHHYWNGWWMRRALSSGHSLYHTPYLHYPDGLSLVGHDIAWFTVVSWIILEPLLGGLVAYNWTILISLALCGLAAFALACELTGDFRAAFLAGLLYQNWPFRLYQPDHPNLVATMWIPLFLLFLIRLLDDGKWWHGLAAGIFLTLAGYTRWQQLVPAIILGGIYFLLKAPSRLASWRRWLPSLILGGIVASLAFTPPALLLLRQQQSDPAALLRPGDEMTLQTDLLAYVTPSDSHSLLRGLTQPAYARYYPDRSESRRFPAYIGVTALALAVLGLWHTDRQRTLPWAAMALTMVLLALGPVLRVNGRLYPQVPMPYRLAARLPLISVMRFPDRFNLFLAAPIAMLAAFGVRWLLGFASRRMRMKRGIILALLGTTLMLEYIAIPIPLIQIDMSPFFHQLAEDRSEFALLNLPLEEKLSKRYMFAQVTHQHPIVQGHVSRFPQGAFEYMSNQPWIQALRIDGELPPRHTDVSRQLATLAQDGVKYVVLHKASIPDRLHQWRHYFPTRPRFEDKDILVYSTSMVSGQDFALDRELAPGLGVLTATVNAACLCPGQPIGVDVAWAAASPPRQDLTARIGLMTPEGTTELTQSFPVSAGWPTSEWSASSVAWGYYALDTPSSLPPDIYTVTVALQDEATNTITSGALRLGPVLVSGNRCADSVPPGSTNVNALFGTELRLLGYELSQDETQMTVELHWRAERLMGTDYKVSVELYDADTSRRVARYDGMPQEWAYPTTLWRAGGVVADELPLSLEGLPLDIYHLAVSVYDPDSGNRLQVIASNGRREPADQLVLPVPGGTDPRAVKAGTPTLPPDWVDISGCQRFERDLLPELTLLGGGVKHEALPAGETVAVHLIWKSTEDIERDYRVRLALIGDDGTIFQQQDTDLLDFEYPTGEWQPGDVLQNWYRLPTPDDLPSGDVGLVLNLLGENGEVILPESVEIHRLWIQAIEPSFELPTRVQRRSTVILGEKVALLGHDLSPQVQVGERVVVTLYWQAQQPMSTSYKVFVHLYGDDGTIVAQRDRLPGLGIRPTTEWGKGEVVADRYFVALGPDLLPGAYTVCAGLYDPRNGVRLTVVNARGERLPQDCIGLGTVDVEP